MNILIFNPFGIGDVLFSTPVIKALKKRYPSSRISYICNKRTKELLVGNPNIESIHIFEKDDFREEWKRSRIGCLRIIGSFLAALKRGNFDLLIDMSLGGYCAMFCWLIGIRDRIGFNYKERGRFLTKRLDISGFNDKHAIEYYLDLVRLIGIEPADKEIELRLSEKDRQWAGRFLLENGVKSGDTVIGVIPGCGASWGKDAGFRRWDKANFAAVADRMSERYKAKIMLFGSRNEVGICEEMAKMMKDPPVMACGKTSLGEFFALMKECDLVITNDGGPLHVARGLGVKTVSIFGPVDEKVYGPYPAASGHLVISNRSLPCRPCYKNFKYTVCAEKKCLNSITREMVIEAAQNLLSTAGAVR